MVRLHAGGALRLCCDPFNEHLAVPVGALKANVVISCLNPTTPVEKCFDYRKQPVFDRSRENEIVLSCERFAQEWKEMGVVFQPFERLAGKVVIGEKEVFDVAAREKPQKRLVLENGPMVLALDVVMQFVFHCQRP